MVEERDEAPALLGNRQIGIPYKCKCGHGLFIPPDQNGREFRCPQCLAIIKPSMWQGPQANKDSNKKILKDVRKPEKKNYEKTFFERVVWKQLIKRAGLWGLGAAVLFGTVAAVTGAVLSPYMSPGTTWGGPAKVWGLFGVMTGLMLGGTWGVAREGDLLIGGTLLVGGLIGTAVATADWLIETFVVSFTEVNVLNTYVVGIFGGLVSGLIAGLVKGEK
jgi:hypothetical protein